MPFPSLPPSWESVLANERWQRYFQDLERFVEEERSRGEVYPAGEHVFAALELTAYEQAGVVVLGQDPYPGTGQAHGLCFSVRPGVRVPGSLLNIFKELRSDLGIEVPRGGCLEPWARQGVLLLNTTLTVRAGEPLSHHGRGWETFTDSIIAALNRRPEPAVFVLWGGHAQKKRALIDAGRHPIITAPHPSPLSAHGGFFGSRPFTRVNDALRGLGRPPVDWRIDP